MTVGLGVAPNQSCYLQESWTVTTGRELHPALKNFYYLSTNLSFLFLKSIIFYNDNDNFCHSEQREDSLLAKQRLANYQFE